MKLPFFLQRADYAPLFEYRSSKPLSTRISNAKFNSILRNHKRLFNMSSKGVTTTEATNIHYKAVNQVKSIINNSYSTRVISTKHADKCTVGSLHGLEWIDDLLSETLFSIEDIYSLDLGVDCVD